jgi:ElaB/YqjD/DUF883 family membrane-anchored ribosome-binding protein
MAHSSADNARQKRDELKDVIADRYTHLRSVLAETEGSVAQSLCDAGKHAADVAAQARDAGVEKAREMADDLDQNVHRHPWTYIGGSAVVGLLLGLLLGRNGK